MAHRNREVAVMCWFPTGDQQPIPVSIKFKDDNDEIILVKEIRIKEINQTIQGREFKCESVIGGLTMQYKLIFFANDCKWILSI